MFGGVSMTMVTTRAWRVSLKSLSPWGSWSPWKPQIPRSTVAPREDFRCRSCRMSARWKGWPLCRADSEVSTSTFA